MDKYVEDLLEVYTLARQNLIKSITTKKAKGNLVTYQQELLKQVDVEIKKLNQYLADWVNGNIPEQYMLGANGVNEYLRNIGAETISVSQFAQLHKRAIATLVVNTQDSLITANNYVGRQMKDAIRQATLEAIQQKLITGQTVKDAKNDIVNRLITTNADGVKMSNGRVMNLQSYAEMVARTTTREATNRGILNQMTESGRDLVKMSSHKSSCKICAPLEGRVYSISGKSSKYPPLKKAYRGPYANIHPNCRHVLVPYIPELADDEKGDLEFSNRSFDTDPRSQASIDRYNSEQKEKSNRLRDRRQWERYKMLLPQDTPNTLSGFRRMKKANNERFQELQNLYRNIRMSST